MDELAKATPGEFPKIYKKAKYYLDASFENEKQTLESIDELAPGSDNVKSCIEVHAKNLELSYNANKGALKGQMAIIAGVGNLEPANIELTDLEQQASEIIPRVSPKVAESDFRIERGIRDGSIRKDIDPMFSTLHGWTMVIGYVKVMAASGASTAPIFHYSLQDLKEYNLKLARLLLAEQPENHSIAIS